MDRFAEVARACGLSASDDDAAAARGLMEGIDDLLTRIKIPTLAEFGVDSDAFTAAIDKMAADAEASGSPANTIKPGIPGGYACDVPEPYLGAARLETACSGMADAMGCRVRPLLCIRPRVPA